MLWWKNLSVSRKLYCVVGTMGLLIAMELFTLLFAMRTLSAVRAFVAGEGYWSKAQKDSISSLQKYVITQNEDFYQVFLERVKVPLGDHKARLELEKETFDYDATVKNLLAGKNHPDDIPEMIKLLRRFGTVTYLEAALVHWREADVLLEELLVLADRIHKEIKSNEIQNSAQVQHILKEISILNEQLTVAEDGFSNKIGIASRWLENFLLVTLIIAVITIEGTGLFLTISFSQTLTSLLGEMNFAAREVGKGNFNQIIPVHSKDELGQLADSLNTMTESLKDQISAVNIRDQFLSIASHELKTPLTTLKLQAQIRKRYLDKGDVARFTPEKIYSMVEDDENQINRLIRLVDDMLDISRIRSGKFVLQYEKTELVSLVNHSLQRLAPQILDSNVSIDLKSEGEIHGVWDAYRLEQVFINLITNALKYGNNLPVLIRVFQNQNEAIVCVTDLGRGISEADKERIFEQFERAISPNEVSGLGLGLYISRQIVLAHGGSISVEGHASQGSTFMVKLPLT